MQFLEVHAFIFFLPSCYGLQEDYYWREYLGSVPSDAVVGGKDIDGNNVYIGQAYLKYSGLIVGRVIPGEKQMYVPYGNVTQIGKYIKVLCGLQENFYWMQANHTNLHLKVLDKRPVIGGHHNIGDGYLNIGRISVGGDTKIGKIVSFFVEDAYFLFDDNGTGKKVFSYEVLMYRNSNISDIIKIK